MNLSRIQALGLVRAAIGLGLVVAPRTISRLTEPTAVLLVRMIGVRDLALGGGAALAGSQSARPWGIAALASDILDVVFAATALRSVGGAGGVVATISPITSVAAGVWALKDPRLA